MEYIKFVLIALLIAQCYFNRLSVFIGLFVWTIVWVPIAFIVNLVITEPIGYFGFWVVVWDWSSSTWADLIHANIGAGLASLMTLALTSKKGQKAILNAATEVAEGEQPK